MRILIVYYSRTGNTKNIAEKIKKTLNCDIEEIKEKVNRLGIWGYIQSGRESCVRETPKICDLRHDFSKYDLIIVGTPIWAFTLASPVRSFLVNHKNSIKKFAFFCTQEGSGGENAIKEVEGVLGKKSTVNLICKANEIKNEKINREIEIFINQLK